MDTSHYALRHEPRYLDERQQLHRAVSITFIAYALLRETQESVIIPVNESLLQQPGEWIRPYDSLAPRSAVSQSQHTDVEGVKGLQPSSCGVRTILHHPSRLSPFLESLDDYKFGSDDGFQE